MTRRANASVNRQLSLWGDQPRKSPGEITPVVRRNGSELEMVELVWGLQPRNPGDRAVINIRSEGRRFSSHRCLVPASEFRLRDSSGSRWRFTLADGELFYFAGVWRPGSEDWPDACAVLTVAASPDIAPYHDRQMAVIPRSARMEWLDHSVPEEVVLRPLPQGTFRVERAR